ncbi:hypothetical protein BD626DRAFT_502109 [Schizophyllum amplum]|uniref:Uncharacterized protein n=1 Tax=Schizophyllum amplum TaxID=97359 RepID=A0A550C933_9AGAR|nr:hypothetical protein BD626DRAFT_502109 [Auriculariopsis ampla]
MADDATEMADDVTEPISDVATEPFSDIATDPLSDVAIQPFSNVVTQPLSDATTELDAMEEGTDDTTYLTLADDYSMSPTYAPMDTDTDEDTERERILSSPAALQWRKLRAQYSLRRTYMTQNLREVPRAGPSIQEEDEGTEAHPYIEPLASGACPECGQLCETKKEWIDHAWCYNIEHNIDIDSD